MMNSRQLQECIDDIRDGSEDAVKKLVNEYYTFYLDAAYAARLSKDDAKHFANHATRSLFSNIRSISDAETWQSLADRELENIPQFITEVPEPPQPVKPANPKASVSFDEEEPPREERQLSAKERLAHLFDDEEEDETEEIRKPVKKQEKKKPKPVYDEEDAEEAVHSKKKKNKLMSAIFVTDDEEEAEETEEIRKPVKKQAKKKPEPVYEEEDDYDEEDDESGFHLPIWLLALLAVLLLIGFTVLAVKIFLPDTWESLTGKLGHGSTPAATAKPTPEPTPSETPEYTVAPNASAEPSAAESAAPTQEPEPETPANAVIGTASVKVDSLNIRSKPSTSGDRAGQAVNGKSYDVYEIASGEGYTWYRIADNKWIADKNGQWVTYTAN